MPHHCSLGYRSRRAISTFALLSNHKLSNVKEEIGRRGDAMVDRCEAYCLAEAQMVYFILPRCHFSGEESL